MLVMGEPDQLDGVIVGEVAVGLGDLGTSSKALDAVVV
jgi:hypothetical protein